MSHDDYEVEPVPGLPAHLPEGEKLLWQGAPLRSAILRDVFHVRLVLAYFGLLIGWRVFETLWIGGTVSAIVPNIAMLAVVCAAAVAILVLLAHLTAKTTVYSITSKRVVMRYGIALPITVNLPFAKILSADMKNGHDGVGDIALKLAENRKLGYVHLWPHVRPWHVRDPQPVLRAIPDVGKVANLLSTALLAEMPDAGRTAMPSTGGRSYNAKSDDLVGNAVGAT